MSIAFNQVVVAGNLTRAPELKRLSTGTVVCDAGLAINEFYKDGDGVKQQRVDFVDVTFFNRTAEVVAEYCIQGSAILVGGKLRFEQWESDGQKRSKLKIVADRMQLIGGKQNNPPQQKTESNSSRWQDAAQKELVDDDIPF